MEELRCYLDDLESQIDPEVEDQLIAEWLTFTNGDFQGDIFQPKRQRSCAPQLDWPAISINATLEDKELMLLRELNGCSQALNSGGGALLNIRANYGTCILATLFGAEVFYMDEAMNTLPTNRHLPGGPDRIKAVIDEGVPDLHTAFGGKVIDWATYSTEILKDYPKLSKYVHVYHPDIQGPMDVCELLWGSTIFLDILDQPELVQGLLKLITETYTQFMDEWIDIVPLRDDYSTHWGLMQKGNLMIRNDSAMNFSPSIYEAFILPYDQHLFDTFGGGAVHFCGRGSHYIHHLGTMPGLYAVNLSQPEYNDMETIYRNTVDKGIKLLGLRVDTAMDAIASGRNLHGNVHCW